MRPVPIEPQSQEPSMRIPRSETDDGQGDDGEGQTPVSRRTGDPRPAGRAALGQHGVNIGQFVMQFNERTKEMKGTTIPVEITIYSDRTFEFITKSPPAAVLLKQAAGIASGRPSRIRPRWHGHHRPGQEDRRDQVRGPERPRPRTRLPDHRRHGPQHGRRRQGLSRRGAFQSSSAL